MIVQSKTGTSRKRAVQFEQLYWKESEAWGGVVFKAMRYQ
jgi:hypothetical protein